MHTHECPDRLQERFSVVLCVQKLCGWQETRACDRVCAKRLAATTPWSQSWEKESDNVSGWGTDGSHTLLTVIQMCTQLLACRSLNVHFCWPVKIGILFLFGVKMEGDDADAAHIITEALTHCGPAAVTQSCGQRLTRLRLIYASTSPCDSSASCLKFPLRLIFDVVLWILFP